MRLRPLRSQEYTLNLYQGWSRWRTSCELLRRRSKLRLQTLSCWWFLILLVWQVRCRFGRTNWSRGQEWVGDWDISASTKRWQRELFDGAWRLGSSKELTCSVSLLLQPEDLSISRRILCPRTNLFSWRSKLCHSRLELLKPHLCRSNPISLQLSLLYINYQEVGFLCWDTHLWRIPCKLIGLP